MSIRPTFYGLEIGKTGLFMSQKGLDVTGHNIANVDTAGYTRQRIISTAYDPYNTVTKFKPVSKALVGSGVNVMIHDQVRDIFLDRQFRTEQSLYSKWATRTSGLNYVESLFEGSEMSSLDNGINKLFEAFNALEEEANDREQRVLIKENAESLSLIFHTVYERLIEQQESQNLAVKAVADKINTLAENIKALNKSIYSYEIDGDLRALDLRDKRNLLLDELSALADIEYRETEENKLIVTIGGVELVNHLSGDRIVCAEIPNDLTPENATDTLYAPYWESQVTDPTDPAQIAAALVDVKGGELRAHLDLRDNGLDASASGEVPGIPYFVELINQLARAIVQNVNDIHKTGWTHPGSGDPSRQGVSFFDDYGDISLVTAGNIKLSSDITAEPDSVFNIAASSKEIVLDGVDPEKLEMGNNEKAKQLFNLSLLKELKVDMPGATPDVNIGSFASFITGILVDLSVTLSDSKKMTDMQNTQLLNADLLRTSVSGVSLDEEMTQLIKYQHSYNGASRLITTMDDALDTLINRMGRVGL